MVVWIDPAVLNVRVPDVVAFPVPANTWNFAEEVLVPPSRRSSVVFLSKIVPLPELNGDPPLTTPRMLDTYVGLERSMVPDVMFPVALERSAPCPYPVKEIPFPLPFKPFKVICPVEDPPIVRLLLPVVAMVPAPVWKVNVPATDAAPLTSRVEVGALVPIPTLWLVVSRSRRLLPKLSAVVLFPRETVELFASVREVPFTVKFPPTVVSPVPEVNVVAPVWMKFPLRVSTPPVPPRGLMEIFPVVPPPSVKFWKAVVPRFPVPVRKVALFPLAAEILAVGVPEEIPSTANFAEEEDVPPTNRSRVLFVG